MSTPASNQDFRTLHNDSFPTSVQRKDNQSLRMAIINPWSVANKALAIQDFIIDQDLDLLAITETWLTGSEGDKPIIQELLPRGFKIVHQERTSGRGGGIAVVYRETLKLKRVQQTNYDSFEYIECCIHTSAMIRLCVVYRPPGRSGVVKFCDDFNDYASQTLSSLGLPLIVGDFNYHVNKCDNYEANTFKDMLQSLDLRQHIKDATHKNGNILDLVITRCQDDIIASSKTVDFGFPDHFPVFLDLKLRKPPMPQRKVTYRRLKNLDPGVMSHRIQLCPFFSSDLSTMSLDEIVNTYNNELTAILDEVAPLQSKTITVRPPSPWYDELIRAAKQQRRVAERKWRKTGLTVNRDLYISERNHVTDLITAARSKHLRNAIAEKKGDTKQLFRLVDSLCGKSEDPALPRNGSDQAIAETFSSFFIQKIVKIQESIPDASLDAEMLSFPAASVELASFQAIAADDLRKLMGEMPNKQCLLDPLPTETVKQTLNVLLPAILTIINKSLEEGNFPSIFKDAVINPLLKKPNTDPDDCANYRPVSNLSYVSKILEKVVASQLREHLRQNDFEEMMQSAYRKDHSCETAILKVHNDITRAVADRKIVALVLLDMSAAFDTVEHAKMRAILQQLGISGLALEWLTSYLNGRHQSVIVRGERSEHQEVTCGVPQGSVLGPLLFTLYTLGLGKIIRNHLSTYHLYADDTQIYIAATPEELPSAIRDLEACIVSVRSWLCHHRLKLNETKTEFMLISSKQMAHHLQGIKLEIDDHEILPSKSVRNLGVTMDSNACMEQHVNKICRAAYGHLQAIRRIRHCLDRQSLEIIVHAFVTSRLDFCNSVLLGLKQSLLTKVQRVQNAAARILTKTPRREHITPVLHSLHWLPVEARIEYKVNVLIFKCLDGTAPQYLRDLITPRDPARALRDRKMLSVPNCALSRAGRCSFSIGGPILWNSLPLHLREVDELLSFKRCLKTYLFSKYF